ncbi:MAG: GDP-mannose 4,6-dehydratase [Candidatus Thermoplasmatota archaeon]
MKILVTGSSGQVGSHILEALYKSNHEVVGLDILESNIPLVKKHTILGNICNYNLVRNLIKGEEFGAIIHAAAQISVDKSIKKPLFYAKNNIMGTLNILRASKSAKSDMCRLIYISSAAVYGNPVYLPLDEMHPLDPISPYGVSKLAAEKFCLAYYKVHSLPVVCIRPFNIYSLRQDPKNPYSGVISKFIERVKKGLPPIIYGDGNQTRDFVNILDLVSMIELILINDRAIGEVFNCGTGVPTSINKLADIIIISSGCKLKPKYTKSRCGDIINSYADISKAKNILGYFPKKSLKEGIQEMLSKKS